MIYTPELEASTLVNRPWWQGGDIVSWTQKRHIWLGQGTARYLTHVLESISVQWDV